VINGSFTISLQEVVNKNVRRIKPTTKTMILVPVHLRDLFITSLVNLAPFLLVRMEQNGIQT